MYSILVPIFAGVLYRLDGWGKGDSFLPFKPFTLPSWRVGGVNYTRYAIGLLIAAHTLNWAYILTYGIAVSVAYGDDSLLQKLFGDFKWFIVGVAFGAASLSWGNALWCGCLLMALKWIDIDQAWFEFLVGSLGTLIFVLK